LLEDGRFDSPCGITVNNKYSYICDLNNHRVQLLHKENGTFYYKLGTEALSSKLGGFAFPYSIFYHAFEEILYVGDQYSLQLFIKENNYECIQRIGDTESGSMSNQFCYICGICEIDDYLYLSDCNNYRIQILGRN